MNLANVLPLHARNRADHPAIIAGDDVVLYRDLDRLVRCCAGWLMDQGLQAGDRVGLCLRDSIEHVVLHYAVARLGAVIVPLDWRWLGDEKSRVAVHFGVRLALIEPGAEPIAGIRCVPVDESWSLRVSQTDPERAFPTGDGPLVMSLSSGTTGRPKGPCHRHAQFERRFFINCINIGFNTHDRYVSATPLYFGGGRTYAMLMLYVGGTVVLFPPPYEPEALVEEVARRNATCTFLVPTLLRRLLELPTATLAPMRSMRFVMSSGAALSREERHAIRKRLCANFIEYYASTEGGGISVLTAAEQERYDESVGRPVFGTEVQIVDETHQSLAPGEIGRIRYRGPAVADGFHNDPEATKEAFRDGWFYPGDLGTFNDEGFLFLKGRAKDMIIRGGINIYPAEIEATLTTHPAVVDAAVVGWPSREFNEEVAAFVVLRSPVAPEALIEHCRGKLARYKTPREVFIVDALPRSSLGKVLKADLAARLDRL